MRFLAEHKWLLIIFLFALFLRLYKLPQVPYGFHVDEVFVGWNAYSILKTGADDWGHKFPLHYNTFGDFRPTGYFYLTIPSILIFGLNEFAVRLPGAFFGALTVVSLYLFVRELSSSNRLITHHLSLITATMLALSPWHISLSRATSEAVVAIFLVITGLWLLLHSQQQTENRHKIISLLFSFFFFLFAYFFYHSARLLVPLLATATVFLVFKRPPTRWPLVFCGLLFLTTILFALSPAARGRLNQVSIFSDLDIRYELDKMPFEEGPGHVFEARLFHNKPSVYIRRFINEYAGYFSAKFLLVPKEAKPARYMTVGMGVLTYIEFALFIAGLIAIAQRKSYAHSLFLFLLLLAPLPAALTTEDAPNLSRAAFMLPFLAIIEAYGWLYLASFRSKPKNYPVTGLLGYWVTGLLILNFVFFWHQYFVHNRVGNTLNRNIGAKELALRLKEHAPRYDKILLTDIPDSPYPWIAFFSKFNPQEFNTAAATRDKGVWVYKNFEFTGQRCPSHDAFQETGKILAVDADACETPNGPPGAKMFEQLKRPDETVVYTLWSRE